MVFARDPRTYAVAGWPLAQARGREPPSRQQPIGVHRVSSRRNRDVPADEALPTGHHPAFAARPKRQVAGVASQTLGTRLGSPYRPKVVACAKVLHRLTD